MPDPMLLWVTRSAPFNVRTRAGLADLGHRSITVPALHILPVEVPSLGAEPTAIAFTSAHGVRHHRVEERWLSLPVFAVGGHSAELAREWGYADVRSAGGNVSDLRDLIAGSVSRFAHVVHFGAREPAGSLVDELRSAGRSAELAVVYESVKSAPSQLRSVLATLPFVDGIILHSPKGAEVASDLVRQAGWSGIVFCLSQACAAPFETLPGLLIETAAEPTEESLLGLVSECRGGAFRPVARSRGFQVGPEASPTGPAIRLVVSNDRPCDPPQRFGPGRGPDDPPPAAA
jgi:uroporphyrinogen-III synthase